VRSRRFKFLLALLLSPLLVATVLLLLLCAERVRGRISLARLNGALAAKAEVTTAGELATPADEAENGAPEVMRAVQELVPGAVLPQHYPPRMVLTPSGRAVLAFREPEWVEGSETNRWEQLAEDLQKNKAVLNRIRAGLSKRILDNRLDYSEGHKLKFQHLLQAKSLIQWFGGECQLALHENQMQDALTPLVEALFPPQPGGARIPAGPGAAVPGNGAD
jgi:hypothetical protein